MLFLSASEIRSCFSCDEAMAAAKTAMAIQEHGEFSMPERLNMKCGGKGDILLAMPCGTESAIATKVSGRTVCCWSVPPRAPTCACTS